MSHLNMTDSKSCAPVARNYFAAFRFGLFPLGGSSPRCSFVRYCAGGLAAFLVLAGFGGLLKAVACPFCSAVSQTIRQEMGVMDAVVIAQSTSASVRNEETGEVVMNVVSVLKGEEHVKAGSPVTVVYFGDVGVGRKFMLSGVDPPKIQWSAMPLTDESEAYVHKITELPDDGLERLKFYQGFLQNSDPMLSRDAYDEFAITPYPIVQSLKPFMDHSQLVQWIQDPEMPADRKRLYLTMLGVCGDKSDVPMLEKMLRSDQPSSRSGLDALAACYLTLAGEDGLKLIEDLFLSNKQSPYADTYSAIMAVRFHGTETDIIPRSSLVKSLHHVLERKDLADLVIPDLSRWGDWSQIDRLVQLFIDAEEDNNWVRVPVVNYLRACPKPEAEKALERLREIDPESVRRASSFFSIPIPQAPAQPSTSFLPSKKNQLLASATATAMVDYPLPYRPKSSLAVAALPPVSLTNLGKMISVSLMAFATVVIAVYLVLSGGARPWETASEQG
jgi:hypothetical protein